MATVAWSWVAAAQLNLSTRSPRHPVPRHLHGGTSLSALERHFILPTPPLNEHAWSVNALGKKGSQLLSGRICVIINHYGICHDLIIGPQNVISDSWKYLWYVVWCIHSLSPQWMLICTNSLPANPLASHSPYAHKDSGPPRCWHSPFGLGICNSSMKFELHQATHELDQEENTSLSIWFKVWLVRQNIISWTILYEFVQNTVISRTVPMMLWGCYPKKL